MKKYLIFLYSIIYLLVAFTACKDKGTNPEDQVIILPPGDLTYIENIRPLFVAKCASRSGCHSTTDQAGGLDLTDYQSIRQHLLNGTIPLVIDGDGEHSVLYEILLASYLGRPRMPLDGPYLDTNNTNGVKRWIDGGLDLAKK